MGLLKKLFFDFFNSLFNGNLTKLAKTEIYSDEHFNINPFLSGCNP